jgi:molecular chaperone GrpE (heat shock protein)
MASERTEGARPLDRAKAGSSGERERGMSGSRPLERAMAVDVEKTDAKAVIAGLKVLIDQLMKILTAQHVEVIAPNPGDPFDPTRHEALMQQDSDLPPNHVTQLLQKGYALRERTLRPAQVAVSKAH